jgi:DNA transformation protein and related proteins
MSKLSELPNIGKILARKLIFVGIDSANDLRNTGSESTFIRLRTIDETACINMLYALEGAIQGIRWHGLDETRKEELKNFYNMINHTQKDNEVKTMKLTKYQPHHTA